LPRHDTTRQHQCGAQVRRAEKCNTELHDVAFVVGESIEATYPQLYAQWFGTPKGLHIDAWVKLDQIDGHRITLSTKPANSRTDDEKKLFFINLGAYQKNRFMELHENAFLIDKGEASVKRRAKEMLCQGLLSVHTDDLYDVDDCLEIRQVGKYFLHFEPIARTTSGLMDVWTGYQPLPEL
jgi:hypothetical protein